MSKSQNKRKKKQDIITPSVQQQILAMNQSLTQAVQHHSRGDLSKAEDIYREILQSVPNHPGALHMLGLVAHQVGKNDAAEELITKAIELQPEVVEAYSNLGNVLKTLGRPDEAIIHFRKAIELKPDYAEAHYNLAIIFGELERLDDAVIHYNKALNIKPDIVEAHNNLGSALKALGRPEEAVIHFRKAIDLKPNYAEAHSNLGAALQDLRSLDDAAGHLYKAIALKPDCAEAHNNLGNTLKALGHLNEAASHLNKAIDIKPDFAEAHSNLGVVFKDLGRQEDAVRHYCKAIDIKPDYAKAYNHLGMELQSLGHLNGALAHLCKAIALEPDYAEAYSNQGSVLYTLGRLDDAFESFQRAFDIDPDFNDAHSNLIFCQDFSLSIDLAAQQAERRCWDQKFGVTAAASINPHKNNRNPERRLRIGYVSADFCNHSAAHGFAPLILEHDRENFEVVCYAGNFVKDASAERFKAAASLWRPTQGLSDERLADLIRDDGIDILVDLAGHSAKNRLRVFAYKPAPIQMSGVGHLPPGLSAIDYRLTCEDLTKRSEEALFPEQPIYLHTYMGYKPPLELPPVSAVPCLEKGAVTFGCFNRFTKVSPEAIALWAEILAEVPESRLALKDKLFVHETERDNVCAQFGAFGVAPERLIFVPASDFQKHLASYDQVDIALDPFPHGGGITTLESLLMGVPVVGMGDDFKLISRVGRMMCGPVGLNEWIADSREAYKAIAIEAAQNPERLTELRSTLRQRVQDVYSMFCGDVEKAYRVAWKRWCDGSPAAPLDMTL